ncbi:Hpt domain-containing protein [Marinivivus vitaminiproducens]|uniref:Hpt domain-containing protein n=1 Tax=Marinivivus vitaminiproducens TaxID=3035935 RepID=UPI00279E0A96|nr:Hpt domain-containing protein [Geminicoccaceae bacterium SCSIO 64248]
MAEPELAQALKRLADAFRAELPNRRAIIEHGLRHPADGDARAAMHRELHKLAGLAGSFGHHDLSDSAAEADERLDDLARRQQPIDRGTTALIEAVLAAVRRVS